MGITLADFNFLGTIPVDIDKLNIHSSDLAIPYATLFIM